MAQTPQPTTTRNDDDAGGSRFAMASAEMESADMEMAMPQMASARSASYQSRGAPPPNLNMRAGRARFEKRMNERPSSAPPPPPPGVKTIGQEMLDGKENDGTS